jgi:hypothetical protein
MRLRQIALVAHDLDPVAAQLNAVFGLTIAFRDPAVGVFGLVNAVMPVGGEFLEIVQPVTADASAGRYLKRRGGDAGYMLIFEVPDALAHRARLEGQGVRIIARHHTPSYTFTHFHPGDFGGVLTSIDTAGDGLSWRERFSDWPPAGRHWRESLAPGDVTGIVGASVQARDPDTAAARWSELLQVDRDGAALRLDGAVIRFVPPIDSDGSGIVGIDVAVVDPAKIIARAQDNDIPVRNDRLLIGGTQFSPVQA